MEPFVAIAASVLPQILRHLAGAGGQAQHDAVAQAVTGIVQSVTRASDPDTARQKIASDPNAEAELRVRLSELASSLDDAQRTANATTDNNALQDLEQRITAQLGNLSQQVDAAKQAQLRATDESARQAEDASTARSTLAQIASPSSPSVLAAPILSLVVVLGFFGALAFIISGRFDPTSDTAKLQIVNIVIGALTAGFATVLNFWLGSSQGSKNKDLANFSLQHIQALQAGRAQAAARVGADTEAPSPAAPKAPPASLPNPPSAVVPASVASPSAPPAAPVVQARAPVAGAPSASTADKDAAFQACVALVLKNEGGFVDDPDDPGGATNMGITIGTLRAWRGQPVTVEDVRTLSQQEARAIYRANYWNPLKCDELPLGVDMVVFDFGVNAGIRRSAMTLQQVVGVAQDGIVGPETLAAVSKSAPAEVVDRFGTARLAYYKALRDWPEFGKGWTDREAESQSEARALMSQSVATA